MRLNGWQRVGIVVSIVWAIGAAIYQRNADLENAQFAANLTYRVCTENKTLKQDFDFKSCLREVEKTSAIWLDGSWSNVAFISLAPIPLGWLVVYMLIRIYQWVKAGFNKPDDR